ncbi:uncharacterized protein LOC141715227 [Apium graveolens]|uniref:uncharacterized protein LOC141715227 n=1 Tax=Apium graveolens TaxID=4045 RepID=UPI003D7AC4DA
MKLNGQYSTVRGNILMMYPLPNVSQAYRLFAKEERHKDVSQISTQIESLAFVANRNNYYQPQRNFSANRQQFSGNNGNQFNTNTGTGNSFNKKGGRPNYFCTHCKIPGHSIERCFKIHGYPPNFNKIEKRVVVVSQLSTESSGFDDCKNDSNSSNTSISVDQYNHLMSLIGKSSSETQVADPSKHALLADNMCLLSNAVNEWLIDSGATDHICPDLSFFSSYENIFDNNNYITIPNGYKVKVLHKGSVKLNDELTIQHVLHVPDLCFRLISVSKLCEDLGCQVSFTNQGCFIQGLSQNRPQIHLGSSLNGLYRDVSSTNTSNSEKHCNVSIAATEEARLWHLQMGHLPFSLLHLVTPISKLPTQDTVQCVRSDNALELTEELLKQLYASKGIINQTICAYTPQQNGVVERKHGHLLETARSLHLQVSDSDYLTPDSETYFAPNNSHQPSPSTVIDISTTVPSRQSSRSKVTPSYLQDYVCNLSHSPDSHWCGIVSASIIPTSHHALLSHTTITEHKSYAEASTHPLRIAAIQKELSALETN